MNRFKVIVLSLFLGGLISFGMYPSENNTIISKAKAISGKCVPTLKTGTLLKLKIDIEGQIVFETISPIGITCEKLLQKVVSRESILVMYEQYESGRINSVKVSITGGRTYWGFNGEERLNMTL